MNFYQVMRVMKISMLLICCCLIHVSASTYGQLVNINKKNSTINEVLLETRRQAGYDFFYDSQLFNGFEKRHINLKNATVEEVLKACFSGLPITYTIQNKIVTIRLLPGYDADEVEKQQNGKLVGKIVDNQGRPLSKATIRIIGAGHTTQTGIDGSFTLDLAAGTYTMQVSYLSYQTQQITGVKIEAGEITRMNIAMKELSSNIKEVLVTSTFKKATVSGLLAARKNAGTVTDGISAEEIARTPDNDIGQVLKRVTGVTTINNRSVMVRGMSERYNQAQLDGVGLPATSLNRRDFSFDIIPTEIVSSVVVNKTASPDMSAEFSGGLVSVNTLDIPDANFLVLTLGTGGNNRVVGKDFYRLGERSSSEYFGFYDKKSEMPDGIKPWYWHQEAIQHQLIPMGENTDPLVADMFLSFEEKDLKFKDYDAIAASNKFNSEGLAKYKFKGTPNQNVRLSVGRVYELGDNLKLGFVATGNFRNEQNAIQFNNVRGSDFSPPQWIDSVGQGQNGAGMSYRFNSSNGLVGNIGLQGSNFKIALKNIYARTYSDNFNEAVRLTYQDLSISPFKEQYQIPEALSLQQHQITGEYQFPWKLKAEGMFAVSKTVQHILDERKLKYRRTMVHEGEWLFQSPFILTTAENGARGGGLFDRRVWSKSHGTNYNWTFSLAKDFQVGDFMRNTVKAGYQAWLKKKDLDVNLIIPMMSPWDRETMSQLVPNPILRYSELFTAENIGNGYGQVFYYPDILNGSAYEGKMNINATYLMMDQNLWDKVRLIYGVRREDYNLSNRADARFYRGSDGTQIDNPLYEHMKGVNDQDVRWLPSFNAIWKINNAINMRFSYSKTALRPDFRETGDYRAYDYDLDAYVGGEHVFTTIVDNTDLRFEWYPSANELISVTGYYKYLDAPIELVLNSGSTRYYLFNNMKSARNLGLELEWRKNLSFIATKDWLSDFYVYGNATFLKSEVDVLSSYETILQDDGSVIRSKKHMKGQERPLIGQSPWLLNAGLAYWGEGFGITASYSHRGYRTAYTSTHSWDVEFEIPLRQVDVQLYAKFLKKKMEVKLNLANLLDDWAVYYRNENYKTPYEIELEQQFATKEVKSVGDLKYKKEDGDRILYRQKEGRRYGLSVTYNF
ncbi:carboxypeptidase regulatory-like domain-containing protein [Sphingobacterium kyonggiense]